jgi:hypothetical protein
LLDIPARALTLVIPAKAGIQLCFCSKARHSGESRNPALAFSLLVIPAKAGIQLWLFLCSSFRRKPESSDFVFDLVDA